MESAELDLIGDLGRELLPNVDWDTPAGVDPVNDGVREQLRSAIADALATHGADILLALGFAQPIALVAPDLTWHRPAIIP